MREASYEDFMLLRERDGEYLLKPFPPCTYVGNKMWPFVWVCEFSATHMVYNISCSSDPPIENHGKEFKEFKEAIYLRPKLVSKSDWKIIGK